MNDVERGRRLQELRKSKGLLQRHVGAHFNIDKAAVSEWETGKSAPDRRKLYELDTLLDAGGEVLALYDVAPASALSVGERLTLLEDVVALLVRSLQNVLESGQIRLEAEEVVLLEAVAKQLDRPTLVTPPIE